MGGGSGCPQLKPTCPPNDGDQVGPEAGSTAHRSAEWHGSHMSSRKGGEGESFLFTGITNLPPLVRGLVFVVKSHISAFYPKRILIFHNCEKPGEHSSYFTCGSRDCEINDCCEVSDLGSFTQEDRMLAASCLCGWRVQMQ